MSDGIKSAVIGAIVGSLITGAVSLFINYDQKKGIEIKTVETLSKYFDSVDKDMSYNKALEMVYKDSEEMKSKLKDLESGITNSILLESAKEYAKSNDYVVAISILNSIKEKTSEVKKLTDDYTEKYENSIVNQVNELKNNGDIDEATHVIDSSLKVIPNSKSLKSKKEEVNNLYLQSMTKIVPAYQSGGNEYKEYSSNKDGKVEFFTMGGEKYSNGMTFNADINIFNDISWAIYNLNNKYKSLSFIVCHVDNTDLGNPTVLQVICDGILQKEIPLAPDMFPTQITLDLTGVKQLKLQVPSSGSNGPLYGIGNPIIQ